MARAPAAAASTPAPDDMGDAGGPDAGADEGGEDEAPGDDDDEDEGDEAGSDETTVVTITQKKSDQSYMVYAGPPDEGAGAGGDAGMGAPAPGGGAAPDDTGAPAAPVPGGDSGGEGGAPTPPPQHCDSPGAALKAAMDILHGTDNSGGEAAFQAGYGGDANKPTLPQKY